MTSKLEHVTNEVFRIVTENNQTTLTARVWNLREFNTISGRHEIECFFGIEFEQEQVDAWTTVQNIIDDVMNLWVAPISTAAERGESEPRLIGSPTLRISRRTAIERLPVKHGEQVVASIKDGKLYFNNVEISAYAARRTEPLNTDRAQVAAINRIERSDIRDLDDLIRIDEYQRIATKSAIYPGKGTPFGLMYAALGLAEAGEVQNKVKKAFRDDGVIGFGGDQEVMTECGPLPTGRQIVVFNDLPAERRTQIIKELGGVLWYIAAVCDEIGATMSEVALTNLDELCGRGERNTLRGDGDDR